MRLYRLFLVALCLVSFAAAASAQLSPGDLSRVHRALEGSRHCLECHEASQGVDGRLCLSCHELLGRRLAAGLGLHARDDYRDCRICHIEHHGRGFELIYWGDGGERSFDHRLAGHVLEGRHAALGCRDCHRASLVRQPKLLLAAHKDLDRTFLGLDTACTSCHEDSHRGQLAETCLSCHGQESWKPAPGFDHDATSYPLSGRHRQVACESCHPTVDDTARYRGIEAASCANCHRDPHRQNLGPRCSDCHTTADWQGRIDEARFNHDRTRYPLEGRHREVACATCHSAGLTTPIPDFERCTTCHDDIHLGQLARRADGGLCISCHSVEGFLPARFTLEDHRRLYPLEGAHLAVPCVACHRPVTARELRTLLPVLAAAETSDTSDTPLFILPSAGCTDCHEDIHDGTLDAYRESTTGDASGCTSCHDLGSWRSIAFDHDRSDFSLEGRHQQQECETCHARPAVGVMMTLTGLATTCAGCHQDPHAGQFDRGGQPADCERCHTVADWQPSGFDHDRDASYALEGAHRQVPCTGCHPHESRGDETWIRFRPLATGCVDCHGREPQ